MKKTTSIAVALFAAIFAYYWFVERPSKLPDEAAHEARKLFPFQAADIRSLRLVRPDGSVRIEREGDQKWRMTEPVKARADKFAADNLAATLAGLEHVRTLRNERGSEGLQEMGFKTPRASVEFTLASGAATVVEVGGNVPASSSAFLRIAAKDEIDLVAASAAATFLKPSDDFRDRSLLDATLLDVAEARLTRPEGDLRFRRREDGWWIEAPIEDQADGSAVQNLLSSVIGLRALSFLDEPQPPKKDAAASSQGAAAPLAGATSSAQGAPSPSSGAAAPAQVAAHRSSGPPAPTAPALQGKAAAAIAPATNTSDLAGKGLDPPKSTVRLFSKSGAPLATVDIGLPVPEQSDRCYVRVAPAGGAATSAVVSLEGLVSASKPAASFRARKALALRAWEAAGLNLISPSVTLSFSKQDGTWSASSPASLKVNGHAVEDTLQALADLEIVAYDAATPSAASALGLDPPKARFEVLLQASAGEAEPSGEAAGKPSGAAAEKTPGTAAAKPSAKPLVLVLGNQVESSGASSGTSSGPSGTLYARVEGRPGIFTVPASIMGRITAGQALYAEAPSSPQGTAPGAAGESPASQPAKDAGKH